MVVCAWQSSVNKPAIIYPMGTGYTLNIPLKDDVVRGRDLHSRLTNFVEDDAAPGGSTAWHLVWLWQCWQQRVMIHLQPEDRQVFANLKFRVAGRVGSLTHLAGCFARELAYLETLLKGDNR
jgi:hypothetical protein